MTTIDTTRPDMDALREALTKNAEWGRHRSHSEMVLHGAAQYLLDHHEQMLPVLPENLRYIQISQTDSWQWHVTVASPSRSLLGSGYSSELRTAAMIAIEKTGTEL